MKVKATILLDFSAPHLSQEELSQVVFDAYINYAVLKHIIEDRRLTLKIIKNKLKGKEKDDQELKIQEYLLFEKVISQAVSKVANHNGKTELEIILDFPKGYDYDIYSEAQMRQVVYDMLVQHVCLSHGDDSVVWCSKAKIGSDQEVAEFKPLYEYHKNWFDICKGTKFEVAIV